MEILLGILIVIAWIVVKSLIGAAIDNHNYKLEELQAKKENDKKETLFIEYLAEMSAKIAKADGNVSDVEIDVFYDVFRRIRLSNEKLSIYKEFFKKGLDSSDSVFETANEFRYEFYFERYRPLRELLYHVLCYISLADECVAKEELSILRQLPEKLDISKDFFFSFCNEYQIDPESKVDQKIGSYKQKSKIDPYEILGASKDLSDDDLKKIYREKVRNYHPDVLRGQGVPEEMLSFANEEMAKINEAWAQIKEERHIY